MEPDDQVNDKIANLVGHCKFINNFRSVFTVKYYEGDKFIYPNLSLFSDISNYLSADENAILFKKKYETANDASGKTGLFYKISQDLGLKLMGSNRGLGFTNIGVVIEDMNYQSLDVVPAYPTQIEYFKTNSPELPTAQILVMSSPFYNQTYIHMIMEYILEEEKLGPFKYCFIKQHYAGLFKVSNMVEGTNTIGATVMRISNRGTLFQYLWSLSDEQVKNDVSGIITELLNVLMYLKSSRFMMCHNDLKTKNVFVSYEDGAPRFQIADYDKSSISYKGYRFMHGNKSKISTADAIGYVIDMNKLTTGTYRIGEEPGNKSYMSSLFSQSISGAVSSVVADSNRIMASQIYYLSLDVYTLVSSIFLHPKVAKNCRELILDTTELMFPGGDKIGKFMEAVDCAAGIIGYNGEYGEYPSPQLCVDEANKRGRFDSIGELVKLLSNYTLYADLEFLKSKFKYTSPVDYDIIYNSARPDKRCLGTLRLAGNNSGAAKWMGISSVTGKKHICIDKCKLGKCPTNKYSTSALGITKINERGPCY